MGLDDEVRKVVRDEFDVIYRRLGNGETMEEIRTADAKPEGERGSICGPCGRSFDSPRAVRIHQGRAKCGR